MERKEKEEEGEEEILHLRVSEIFLQAHVG